MKSRGENFKTINITKQSYTCSVEEKDFLPQKKEITGEELILLERNSISCSSISSEKGGVGRVSYIQDAIDNSESSYNYSELLKDKLLESIEDKSFVCSFSYGEEPEEADIKISEVYSSFNNNYITLPDIEAYSCSPYIPNGSELILIGNNKNIKGCSIVKTTTFATSLNNVVENYNIDEDLSKSIDVNEDLLSLIYNNRPVDVKIVDRIGKSDWLVTINVYDSSTESLKDSKRFDKSLLKFSVTNGIWKLLYTTELKTPSPTSATSGFVENEFVGNVFDGNHVLKLSNVKSSDIVYLWGQSTDGYMVALASFKMSDVIDGSTPSSWNKIDSNTRFVVLSEEPSNPLIIINGSMSWLDRDFQINNVITKDFPYNVKFVRDSEYVRAPLTEVKVSIFNPRIHSFNLTNDTSVYGGFVDNDKNQISSIKTLYKHASPLDDDSLFLVIKGKLSLESSDVEYGNEYVVFIPNGVKIVNTLFQ